MGQVSESRSTRLPHDGHRRRLITASPDMPSPGILPCNAPGGNRTPIKKPWNTGGAESGAPGEIVRAWPHLSADARAGILAIVRQAGKGEENENVLKFAGTLNFTSSLTFGLPRNDFRQGEKARILDGGRPMSSSAQVSLMGRKPQKRFDAVLSNQYRQVPTLARGPDEEAIVMLNSMAHMHRAKYQNFHVDCDPTPNKSPASSFSVESCLRRRFRDRPA
jgi:hypothetical protein